MTDKIADDWMKTKAVIKTFLSDFHFEMDEDHRDHNAAALIARLAQADFAIVDYKDLLRQNKWIEEVMGLLSKYDNLAETCPGALGSSKADNLIKEMERLRQSKPENLLQWKNLGNNHRCSAVGNTATDDYVMFSLTYHPTCYRRGPWRLLIEVCGGIYHHKWGCFDLADQPMRYYHNENCAIDEANAIAKVLLKDRTNVGK